MTRRRIAVPIRIFGAFAAVSCWAAGALAAERVTFSLRNTSPVPVAEAVFQSVASGTIVPPIVGTDENGSPIEGSPLTSLPSSRGVDLSHAFTLLLSDPATGGENRDFLSLIFGFDPNPNYDPADLDSAPFLPALDGNGNQIGRLEPNGTFDFMLSLADADLARLIVPTTAGLALSLVDTTTKPETTPGTPNPSPQPTPIPEPSAVALWSLVSLAAAAVARRRRSSRTPVSPSVEP